MEKEEDLSFALYYVGTAMNSAMWMLNRVSFVTPKYRIHAPKFAADLGLV